MPGEIALQPSLTSTIESSQAPRLPKPKIAGIAQKAIEKIKTTVSAVKNANPGDRMKTFLQALGNEDVTPDRGAASATAPSAAQSELTDYNSSLEGVPLTPRTRKFLDRMNRPSLLMRAIANRIPEQSEELKLHVMEQNHQLLSTLVGNEAMQQVENGSVDLGQVVAARVKEIYTFQQENKAPGALSLYLGEPTDETVFPLKRLERALWKDKNTRDAARMLRELRKGSQFTLPQYMKNNRAVLAEGAVMGGAKAVEKLREVGKRVLARR